MYPTHSRWHRQPSYIFHIISKTLPFAFFCIALLFAHTSLSCPSRPFLILIWLSSFWYSFFFPSNSCSILYLFEGHLVLPISLLCQRSRLHLSQTIITAASTAGSKSLVGEVGCRGAGGELEGGWVGFKGQQPKVWRQLPASKVCVNGAAAFSEVASLEIYRKKFNNGNLHCDPLKLFYFDRNLTTS